MVQLQNYGVNTKKRGSQCDVLMCLMTIHMVIKNKKERKIQMVRGLTREEALCDLETGKSIVFMVTHQAA
jgi:hypothetical protein